MALELATGQLRSTGSVADISDVPIVDVPMLDPGAVHDPPDSVTHMRSILEAADGVLIATPEYAGGLAGGVKNALDWLVGSASLYHRPVAILSAGTTGGTFAIEQLVRTLSWQGALTVDILGISAPRTKMGPGAGFTDADTVQAIERWADQLAAAMSMEPESLLERVAGVVTPFGIDPNRFGDLG